MLLLLVAIAGFSYSNSRKRALSKQNVERASLDELLDRGNLDQLIGKLRVPFYTDSKNILIALEEVEKQIRISDRILALNPVDLEFEQAVLGKLTALMEREKIRVTSSEVIPVKTITELLECADEHRDSANDRVATYVIASRVVGKMVELVATEKKDNKEFCAIFIKQELEKLAGETYESEIVELIFEWIRFIESRSKEDARMLCRSFVEALNSSNNKAVQRLLSRAGSRLYPPEIDPLDFVSASPFQRNEAINEFVLRSAAALDGRMADEVLQIAILQKTLHLVSMAQLDQAKKITRKFDELYRPEATSEVKRWRDILDSRMNIIGRPLSLKTFRQLDGTASKFQMQEADLRILFLFDQFDKRKTLTDFGALVEVLKHKLKFGDVELFPVFLDDGGGAIELEELRIAASKTLLWQGWAMDSESPDSVEFLDRLGVIDTPFFLILDNESKVLALGTAIKTIQETATSIQVQIQARENYKE